MGLASGQDFSDLKILLFICLLFPSVLNLDLFWTSTHHDLFFDPSFVLLFSCTCCMYRIYSTLFLTHTFVMPPRQPKSRPLCNLTITVQESPRQRRNHRFCSLKCLNLNSSFDNHLTALSLSTVRCMSCLFLTSSIVFPKTELFISLKRLERK